MLSESIESKGPERDIIRPGASAGDAALGAAQASPLRSSKFSFEVPFIRDLPLYYGNSRAFLARGTRFTAAPRNPAIKSQTSKQATVTSKSAVLQLSLHIYIYIYIHTCYK